MPDVVWVCPGDDDSPPLAAPFDDASPLEHAATLPDWVRSAAARLYANTMPSGAVETPFLRALRAPCVPRSGTVEPEEAADGIGAGCPLVEPRPGLPVKEPCDVEVLDVHAGRVQHDAGSRHGHRAVVAAAGEGALGSRTSRCGCRGRCSARRCRGSRRCRCSSRSVAGRRGRRPGCSSRGCCGPGRTRVRFWSRRHRWRRSRRSSATTPPHGCCWWRPRPGSPSGRSRPGVRWWPGRRDRARWSWAWDSAPAVVTRAGPSLLTTVGGAGRSPVAVRSRSPSADTERTGRAVSTPSPPCDGPAAGQRRVRSSSHADPDLSHAYARCAPWRAATYGPPGRWVVRRTIPCGTWTPQHLRPGGPRRRAFRIRDASCACDRVGFRDRCCAERVADPHDVPI